MNVSPGTCWKRTAFPSTSIHRTDQHPIATALDVLLTQVYFEVCAFADDYRHDHVAQPTDEDQRVVALWVPEHAALR